MNTLRIICIVCFAGLIVGCQTTPPNYGESGRRMDPSRDSPSEIGSQQPRSYDLITATDMMAESIAQRLDVNNRDNPPRIFIGQIENKTSRPYENYQIFLARLGSLLLSSGSRHGLEMIRERDFIEQQRAREYGTKQPGKAPYDYASEAEYVLTATVRDMPSGGTNFYFMNFQLVQLVEDAISGPDAGVGRIVWEDFYEVKFQ